MKRTFILVVNLILINHYLNAQGTNPNVVNVAKEAKALKAKSAGPLVAAPEVGKTQTPEVLNTTDVKKAVSTKAAGAEAPVPVQKSPDSKKTASEKVLPKQEAMAVTEVKHGTEKVVAETNAAKGSVKESEIKNKEEEIKETDYKNLNELLEDWDILDGIEREFALEDFVCQDNQDHID